MNNSGKVGFVEKVLQGGREHGILINQLVLGVIHQLRYLLLLAFVEGLVGLNLQGNLRESLAYQVGHPLSDLFAEPSIVINTESLQYRRTDKVGVFR